MKVFEAQRQSHGPFDTSAVFPSKNLRTHLDPFNFYHRVFVPAVKEAGLEDVTWHTLWLKFGLRFTMAEATGRELQEVFRHSSTVLIKRYAHLSPKHLARVMERVSTFGQQVKEPVPLKGNGKPPTIVLPCERESVTVMPRSASSSSTSWKLRQNQW